MKPLHPESATASLKLVWQNLQNNLCLHRCLTLASTQVEWVSVCVFGSVCLGVCLFAHPCTQAHRSVCFSVCKRTNLPHFDLLSFLDGVVGCCHLQSNLSLRPPPPPISWVWFFNPLADFFQVRWGPCLVSTHLFGLSSFTDHPPSLENHVLFCLPEVQIK